MNVTVYNIELHLADQQQDQAVSDLLGEFSHYSGMYSIWHVEQVHQVQNLEHLTDQSRRSS